MKILLISTHRKTGGASLAAHRLMHALKNHGEEVEMLVQDDDASEPGVHTTTRSRLKRWINFYRFIRERVTFMVRERERHVRFLFSPANTGERVSCNKHVQQADIIHLHWINGGFLSLQTLDQLLLSGKPVIWTFHDMWAFTGGCHYALDCMGYTLECGHCPYLRKPGKGDLSNRIWRRKKTTIGNVPFTIITPSRWLRECVVSSSLLGEYDVHTIHNPIDPSIFHPVSREVACRSLELDPGKKYILFGAANIKNMLKGFDCFKEATRRLYQDLQDTSKDIEIILFGKAKDKLKDLLPFTTHQVSYTGSQERIAEIYSVAHLFVIPSLQDNLPNTVIESQLCGTPVVGFKTGGIPEMVEHQITGYLAEYLSARDLADGMKWILQTHNYHTLSENTRHFAVKRFSMEESVKKHMELYHKILAK